MIRYARDYRTARKMLLEGHHVSGVSSIVRHYSEHPTLVPTVLNYGMLGQVDHNYLPMAYLTVIVPLAIPVATVHLI